MDQIDNADALNLSTGIFTTFIEFAQLAADVLGYQPEIRGLTDKPAGTHARAGDTSKQKQLGFQHTVDFRTGIEHAINYYLK
jgi:GDP-L-fucose synthase